MWCSFSIYALANKTAGGLFALLLTWYLLPLVELRFGSDLAWYFKLLGGLVGFGLLGWGLCDVMIGILNRGYREETDGDDR